MLKEEFTHFTLSILVGLVIGYFFHNYWSVVAVLITGFLIDSDHLIDYFVFSKGRFNYSQFKSGSYFDDSGKVYVFFHGFEFAIILIILGIVVSNLSWLFFSLGFSNLIQLLFDTVANKPIWPTYFITFRIAKNFDHKSFDFKCQK